jgi:hypothetical protein
LILLLLVAGGCLQAFGTLWAVLQAAGARWTGDALHTWRERWQRIRALNLWQPSATLLAGLACELAAAVMWLYS